jgi:hypothetical protein
LQRGIFKQGRIDGPAHEFRRIRLNLARAKEFPAGSSQHGDEFVAPRDRSGHIDPALWRERREALPGAPLLAWRGRPDRTPSSPDNT